MILMKYHAVFFWKIGKVSQNLSPVAVVIGALRVNYLLHVLFLFNCRHVPFLKKSVRTNINQWAHDIVRTSQNDQTKGIPFNGIWRNVLAVFRFTYMYEYRTAEHSLYHPKYNIHLYTGNPLNGYFEKTVQLQMKCSKMLHFIRVCAVCHE